MEPWRSKVIERWRLEGDLRTKRATLLRVMQMKFKVEVPADLARIIETTTDLKTLRNWLDHVMLVTSLDDVHLVMQRPLGPTGNGANGS